MHQKARTGDILEIVLEILPLDFQNQVAKYFPFILT